jgi:hypothetical protein
LKPDIKLPIDAHGELILHGPSGRQITVEASGSRVSVAAPGWTELRQLGPRSLMRQRRTLKITIDALKTFGLTLDINVGGKLAFGLGTGIKPTLLAKLLGLTSADIRFSSVLRLLTSSSGR